MAERIRVTVWNEGREETRKPLCGEIYPEGMHGTIAAFLGKHPEIEVRTATLDEPEHGLTDEVLENTDVLTWWGHCAHGEVRDDIVDKIHARVLSGMGLIPLHSSHKSKIFMKLMGTTCQLKWREIAEKERLWVVSPGHPIAEGIDQYIELPHVEMYGEHHDCPAPDEIVFISWFSGGEVFRSGMCFNRGMGKIFYFRPGHETYPIFHNPEIQRVIYNAVKWAAPVNRPQRTFGNHQPIEDICEADFAD